MREVSQKFNDLYAKRGRFEYCVVLHGDRMIPPSAFAQHCEWTDAFSDGEEFCIGNAYMGNFNCVLKESAEIVPNVGEIIGAYMRIVVDYDSAYEPELIDVTFTARAISETSISPTMAINPMSEEIGETENISEWVLIGTYRVMEVLHDNKTRKTSIKSFDLMWFLENTIFMNGFNPELFPITYANAVQWIRNVTGVPIDNMLNTEHVIDRVADDISCRLVLSYMLITLGANARCKPDGMITGWGIMHDIAPPERQFTPDEPILISEWDYDILETEHPPISGLRVSNRGGEVIFSGDSTGYILDVHIPWLRGQAAVNETLAYIRGYVNTPVLIGNALVNPAIQPWDKVIGRVSGQVYRITYIDVRGGAMPRSDCQNGVWQQFEHPGAESERGERFFGGGNNILIPHLPTPRLISTWHDGQTVHVYDTRYPWDGYGAPPPVYCPGGGGGGTTNPADLISLEDGNAIIISAEDGRLFVSETFGIREWADILGKPATIMNINTIIADLQRQINEIVKYIDMQIVVVNVTFTVEVNYVERLDIITPAMLSANQDGFIVTQSSQWDNNIWSGWAGFSRTNNRSWYTASSAVPPHWLQIQLPSPKRVVRYNVRARHDSVTGTPSSWILQGSNDGITWDDLSNITGQTWATAYQLREFIIPPANRGSYNRYRFFTTLSGIVSIGELELHGYEDTPSIEIEFDNVVHGLDLSHINLTPLTGVADKIALSGVGANYTLDIDVVTEGDVSFAISDFDNFVVTTPPIVLMLMGVVEKELLVVPPMTSNTAPTPFVASAIGSASSWHIPFRAFDRWLNRPATPIANDSWCSPQNIFSTTTGEGIAWLQIDTGEINEVVAYAVHNRTNAHLVPLNELGSPQDFIFNGSNDGVNLTVLDTVTDREFSQTALKTEHKLSEVANYRYYRIIFTKTHLPNPNRMVCIGQLELFRYKQ